MKLGPFSPQELDEMAQLLIQKGVEFEVSFDEDEAQKDIQNSPENTLNLAEFRLKTYLAQHFYIDIEQEEFARFPGLYSELIHKTTKTIVGEPIDATEDSNVIDLHEDRILKEDSLRRKSIEKWVALFFLIFMVGTYLFFIRSKF